MQLGEQVVEHGANLSFAKAKLKCAVYRRGDQLAKLLPPLAERAVGRRLQHAHPLSADPLNDAISLEP